MLFRSGDFWGSQEGCQGPSRPSGRNRGLPLRRRRAERELLYKILIDMRNDITELRRMVRELHSGYSSYRSTSQPPVEHGELKGLLPQSSVSAIEDAEGEVIVEIPREVTKADMQREQIIKALRRNGGSRRAAANELFMSERTLYRKIKELNIEE